jgi:UDP-galactopyranose mutase
MEQWCLSKIGGTLYEIFIEGYTTKQWGLHPRMLPATLLQRLPIRFTFDDNYYKGMPHQGVPINGYTAMIEQMLEGIEVETSVDFLRQRDDFIMGSEKVVYSGAIDEFFNYELGVLTYRSMRFETEVIGVDDFQGNAVINYTEAGVPYTRSIEHKHFDPKENGGRRLTAVTWEYPEAWEPGKDQTYPLRTATSIKLYNDYVALAEKQVPNVIFGGRLGTYSYLDMDQVIQSAMSRARTLRRTGK